MANPVPVSAGRPSPQVFGFYWEMLHDRSGDVVGDGFSRATPPPLQAQPGYSYRITPLCLIAALLDADALAFAAEPAMLGVSTRLERALSTHLEDPAGSFDVPLTALVGDADNFILAQMLLAQLPAGLARLGARSAAGAVCEGDAALSACESGRDVQAVYYRFDLALLRDRIRPLKAAG